MAMVAYWDTTGNPSSGVIQESNRWLWMWCDSDSTGVDDDYNSNMLGVEMESHVMGMGAQHQFDFHMRWEGLENDLPGGSDLEATATYTSDADTEQYLLFRVRDSVTYGQPATSPTSEVLSRSESLGSGRAEQRYSGHDRKQLGQLRGGSRYVLFRSRMPSFSGSRHF
jgi:hypothetical protein